ncbi:ATP-binding protein, partial [Streptomyces sp. DT225]
MEKGRPARFELLEADNRMALQALRNAAEDSYERRDWGRYTRQMVHFHLRNAESWGNEKTGADLAAQVDPGFVLDERFIRAEAPQPA